MIGLFGGTFDPIHYGHLRPALEVLTALRLRELRFVPLKQAVHRPQPQAPVAARVAMLRAAVAGQPGFVLDTRELERPGPSWTYDTLRAVRAEIGADTPLGLLIGGDAFNGFLDWHRPGDILQLAHLIVMHRPGAPLPRAAEVRKLLDARRTENSAALHETPAGLIWTQSVTQLAISATAIRQGIARGESARFLLPEAVLAIIEEQALYGYLSRPPQSFP